MNELLKYFIDNKIEKALVKNITVYGYQYNYEHMLISSCTKYLFEDYIVNEDYMIKEGMENRPGKIYDKHYVVVHDTASSAKTANGLAHAKYVTNGGGGTSWHYTCSSDGIYHHIPDFENAYHAGDGGRTYEFFETNVYGNSINPTVSISDDGYFEIDGVKSVVLAPTSDGDIVQTDRINDKGVKVVIKDGMYYIGNTYYNKTYRYIANAGGNNNGIGIESCLNEGSDIYYTWQKLAKLVAHLVKDNDLSLNDVKPHHYFSGKPCPMTMRKALMWESFMELVKFEYDMITRFSDYTVKLTSHNLEYINELGRIIKQDETNKTVSYTITVTKDNLSESHTFDIVIPGKSNN